MADSAGALTRKLFIIYGVILLTACLVLISLRLALTHTLPSYAFLSNALREDVVHLVQGVGDGLNGAVRTVGRVPHFAMDAVDVGALIRPADPAHVPVIIAPKAVAATALPAAPAVSPPDRHVVATTAAIPTAPPLQASNTYAWGNCTWWVAERRSQVGQPIPGSWGNAAAWAVRAARDGYTVDHRPAPGSIMQTPYSAGGLGHVAFVEKVDQDGTWYISEMNVVGLDVVDHKAEPPAAAANYDFIH